MHRTSRAAHARTGIEAELDAVVDAYGRRKEQEALRKAEEEARAARPDPIERLRNLVREELITVFEELSEKYAEIGVSMHFNPSNLLGGGREIDIELGLDGNRTELHGITTDEAIAFNEVRFSKHFRGELTSGPSLRLRKLDAQAFREFVCERLMMLIRVAMRKY